MFVIFIVQIKQSYQKMTEIWSGFSSGEPMLSLSWSELKDKMVVLWDNVSFKLYFSNREANLGF